MGLRKRSVNVISKRKKDQNKIPTEHYTDSATTIPGV